MKVFAKTKKCNLTGRYDPDTNHLIVEEGSTYSSDIAPSLLKHNVRYREEILKECGSGAPDYKLLKEYEFKSPSAAASILSGSQINGLDFFITENNKTLNEELFGKKDKQSKIHKRLKVLDNTPIPFDKTKPLIRKYQLGKAVLKSEGFTCFYNAAHETFLTDSGDTYMEAHHLIPLKYQSDFDYSLQVPANVVCLCPKCHREIHYGKDKEKILKALYDDRIEDLKKSIVKDIKFEDLLKYYDLKRK